jgi:predicted anti-sigma-YlaC factor YlaD
MTCDIYREAISAEMDGEDPGLDQRLVDAHLRRCASCRAFAVEAADLKSALRFGRIDAPDLTAPIVARALDDWDRRWLTLPVRLGLVFVGAGQLALAVPGLLYGSDDGAPIHVAHEIGSWDLALAVGFLFAAWRPLRAVGLLPFVAVLSFCLGLTAVVDLLHGRAVAVLETSHLLELVGTLLLWLLVHPLARRARVRPPKVTVAS